MVRIFLNGVWRKTTWRINSSMVKNCGEEKPRPILRASSRFKNSAGLLPPNTMASRDKSLPGLTYSASIKSAKRSTKGSVKLKVVTRLFVWIVLILNDLLQAVIIQIDQPAFDFFRWVHLPDELHIGG